MIDPSKPDYANTPVSELRPRYRYAPADPGVSPAVSIVTPFYNAGPVFHETADSVFRQSFQQWEWIIVYDCSESPESAEFLEDYARRDPRVSVLRSAERGGPAAARNLGVQAARAPYIAFLDSDDLYEPTTLEKWLWFLESHPRYAMVKGFQAGFGAEEYIWRQGFHSGAAILKSNVIQTACMIRREVYVAVGGMDATIRGGMEDWEFWLRCANAGHWGGTIPEVLDWYRRRPRHNDYWADWDNAHRQKAFRAELQRRYPRLFEHGMPHPELETPSPYSELPALPEFENRLRRAAPGRRLLVIVPHLVAGGSDKFTLDLLSELVSKHEFEVTVASTLSSDHNWRHRFEALTPDVFTLDSFLRLRDYPRFLAYLIRSRGIDSVLVTHSQLGYQLLPYLRSERPGIACYDYVHIEEPAWKSGGYPAFSIAYRHFLDHTAASSAHLREWMVARGAAAEDISVVTTNVDSEAWSRKDLDAGALRRKWRVPPGVPVVLFAGRLCEQKQPNILAAAVHALHVRGIRFLCLVAGDGEQEPWLRRFVRQNRLHEVRLLGLRTNEEIRGLLAIADVFFLPSKQEGISLAVYEAMAMQAVPVSADVGGQRELVTPECGILIQPGGGEVARYTEALAGLLEDGPRREEMAEAGRRRVVDCFPLGRMGEAMAEILRGGRNRRPFDLAQALQAFTPGFAREIVEQRRTELLSDHLWNGDAVTGLDSAGGRVPSDSRPAPVLWRTLAVLYPLLAGRQHRRNRKLLLGIVAKRKAHGELLAAFDSAFYRCSNPDVPPIGPLPLLHYLFHGYREGRRPSPDFEQEEFLMAHPEAGGDVNPLLWKISLT